MSDVIAQLPEKAFEGISDHLLCSICYSPSDQWLIACDGQHSFCAVCLHSHEEARTRADGEASCPECRGELIKNSADHFKPDRLKNKMTLEFECDCPQKCGDKFSLDKLKAHMQEKCPNGLVPCPMAGVGCEHIMKRCEVQQHLKDDNHSHLAMGFMLKMADSFKTEIGSLKTTLAEQQATITSQAATITNLNTALASHSSTMTNNTSAISGFRTKLDTVERKLNETLSDGEYSLKQIAIQTRKRASPGEGTSGRAVRGRAQVVRQKAEIDELKEKLAAAEPEAAEPAAAPAAAAEAPAPAPAAPLVVDTAAAAAGSSSAAAGAVSPAYSPTSPSYSPTSPQYQPGDDAGQ